MRQAFEFGMHLVAQGIALVNQPAEAKLGGELIGPILRLSKVAVPFEREQHAKKRGFRKPCAFADLLQRQGSLAVEAIKNIKCAADGAQVILLVGRGLVGMEGPFGDAAPGGLCYAKR